MGFIKNYRLRFLGKILTIGLTDAPDGYTFGMANETEDCYFVPFLDYDNTYLSVVERDIRHIQQIFQLGSMILMSSSFAKSENGEMKGNWHVIGFDKLPYGVCLDVVRNTRCDRMSKRMPTFYPYRNWVLRSHPKGHKGSPEFVRVYPAATWRECSSGHYIMVSKLFKIPKAALEAIMKTSKTWDRYTTAEVVSYLAKVK